MSKDVHLTCFQTKNFEAMSFLVAINRGIFTERMIRGLTQVSWERVDVCFHKSWLRYNAHNNIQVRFDRYWNSGRQFAFLSLTNCGFILQLTHQLGVELLSICHCTWYLLWASKNFMHHSYYSSTWSVVIDIHMSFPLIFFHSIDITSCIVRWLKVHDLLDNTVRRRCSWEV